MLLRHPHPVPLSSVVLVLATAFAFAPMPAQSALPQPSSAVFAKGAKFTVSGYTGSSPLSGFPVLVRIGNNSPVGFSYSDVQNANAADKNDIDIAFVDMLGNGLPFEIDTWDTAGTSLIWVRLPTMTSGTQFVMCWGSSSSGKIVCGTNPWSGYAGVWHMNETGTPSSQSPLTIHDSTANGLDGSTPVGEAASGSVVGGAWRIAKDNNHERSIRVPVGGTGADPAKKAAADALGTDFHASFWMRAKGVVQWSNIICRRKGDLGTGWGFSFHENSGSAPKLMRVYAGGTTPATSSGSYNLGTTLCATDNAWKKVDVVWKYAENNNVQVADIYLNGAYLETVNCLETANQQDTDIGIGCSTQDIYNSNDKDKKGRRVNAEMDEVRLGAFVPTADWIAADYATQSSPSSFLTAGTAEPLEATADPMAGVVVSSVAYTNATVEVTISSLGTGATSAGVTVEIAATDTFASPVWTETYTATAAGSRSFNVASLATNTAYFVRAVVANNVNGSLTTFPISFTTLAPGAPAGTALFQDRGFSTLSATATATALGTGAESATMRLEASTDGFATVVAGAEIAAILDTAVPISVSGLAADTAYALRVRFRNDWGIDTFVALSDTATRTVPFSTIGIGWTFSPDGSTIDITFDVSGIYDGASGTATLTYNGVAQGQEPIYDAGTVSWTGIAAANGTATATIVLTAFLDGQTYSQTFTAAIAPGSTAVSVSDISEHISAATAIRIHPGDVVTLPELSGTASYILGNRLFGSLDGNVLTALRPGILGIHGVGNDSITNTMAVLVLPEKIGNGDIYIFTETSISGNNNGLWCNAGYWDKVGAETNDSWPQNQDDIAIIPFYSLETKSVNLGGDVTVGALYVGGFRDTKANITLGTNNSNYKRAISFRRTDGGSATVQLCSNSLHLGNEQARTLLTLSGGLRLVDFLSDTVLSGGWDGSNSTFPQGRFTFSSVTNRIGDGVTVELREMDTQGVSYNAGTLSLGNLSGAGTFWNHSSGLVKYAGDSSRFAGLIRDSGGHNAGGESQGRSGPAYFRTTTLTNAFAETAGWVGSNGQDAQSDYKKGVGTLYTGYPHFHEVDKPHLSYFPARGATMHGGYIINRYIGSSAWTNSAENSITRDVKRTAFLKVDCGFNYLYGDANSAAHPGNDFIADALVHTNKATLRIDDTSRFSLASSVEPPLQTTVLHGVSTFAFGAGGNPEATAAYSVVPWIAGPVASNDKTVLLFACFDGNDRFVRPDFESKALASWGDADNAIVWSSGKNSIALAADKTVNSLVLDNSGLSSADKRLGAGRTLSISSGGLVFSKSGAVVGTEGAEAANGALVLGNATHPAYVWARGSASSPNQIWAKVTAPGGFVAAYTGHLILGGNQTGIGDELVVNAGTLQLGTATSGCSLARELPVRIFANATLALPAENALTGTVLQFDGAAGWFGKANLIADQRCRKLYVRDYPEAPEWDNLPRGTYGSSESAAEFIRDDLFTGTGVLSVLSDDMRQPLLIRFH